jgi:4-hydroxy-2-oxoheptanedioate aldolase
MAEIPRLNGVIRALEQGQAALTAFLPTDVEQALALSVAKYDGIVFEMEHNPYDIRGFRDCLQYLLNRRQIAQSGSLAPIVTPMARIPPNGAEQGQWQAKQVFDLGAYGIIWPHISTVEQAYYQKADVWPLNKNGEIFVILMIEDTVGIRNLKDILRNVPGIGAVLIGEGDLSQELGYPRQYEHKVVLEAMAEIVRTCKEHNVVVGHPHVEVANAERVISEGYRFLMCAPARSYAALDKARGLAGRT